MTQPLSPDGSPQCEVVFEIDARGLACPLPLLKAKQGLQRLQPGECLRIFATDAGSVRDFHAFAALSGNRILQFVQSEGGYTYVLQKTMLQKTPEQKSPGQD